jgi:hypothetical protein
MTSRPSPGIYDRLLDQDLTELLAQYPELRALFRKLEAEEQPSRYAEFVSQVLKQALLEEPDPESRRDLCNRIIDMLSGPAGSHEAVRMEHLFCSIQMMTSRQLWDQVGASFYDYIVVDEAHHGRAASYRPLFDHFEPKILLGLTATPERMDGDNVKDDFHHRFAAEIRLPEALEEKLLCPFHYFGVADPVDISKDHFWRNGRYDDRALEKVYTGDDILAKMRVDTIVRALDRYEPARQTIKGVGFCVTIRHARFMADAFNRHGIASAPSDPDLAWAGEVSPVAGSVPDLPFPCSLELHAQFSATDILAAFDRATLASAGQRGTGVLHFKDIKAYALLITFQKTEKEFSPTTMYADYPISRSLLHWESQSGTAMDSPTGQNLVHHQTRGYTILVFARPKKKHNNCTVPFVFLGPARYVSHQKERPIQMVWKLSSPMPVEMFEENRRGG